MASSTVLAWCQKELELFIDLSFIPPITDLSYPLWSNGKALLCLAHRYYPTNIPDFAHQLVQPNTLLFATDLFQLKLGELPQPEQGIATYVETLHSHLDIAHSPIDTNLNEEFMSKAKRLQSQLDDFYTHLMECRDDESKEPANSRDFAGLEESQQSVRSYINSLSSDIVEHPSISALISSIEATEAAISLQTNKSGITSPSTSSVAAQIRNELEFIQAKMLKTTTTDPGIQDLEERAEHAGKMLETLENKEQYDALFEKYQLIVSWVDDVRVWFVEAERIRNWIEERIQLLESKPALDALYDVEIEYTLEQVERLNQDQVALENEVEVFDKQDMSRLRAHVKALTGTERGNKDLSPADTTTIEITFTTLMTLDRLMHLMRRRAYELQMLALRMYWEIEYEKTVSWVRSTTENVKSFVKHKARWQPDTADENTKTDIINALVEFEQQCMAFDQGQFTTTVNMYQDLDDACKVELPTHLESRQVAIEEAFEELTNRIAFARQVVEQHLVLADFLNHADQLKNEGEQLRQEINKAEQLCLPGKEFTERVGLFQENAIRVATTVASRVPYPETTHPADQEENEDANQVIRTVIGARKSALILFGEALDQSLSAHRRALQLQKRAKQLQDDVNRLSGLMDERIRTVEKSKIDVFVGKCGLDETDLSRLNKERDGQVSRMNSIRENDMKKLVDNIKSLETACQSSQIQVNSVITGMDSIEQQLVKLDESLQKHSSELEVLGKRISWESQHAKSAQWVTAMTGTLWDFVSHRAQWRPRYEFSGVPDWKSIWEDFNAMKQKVELFHDEQLKPTDDIFSHLVAGFGIILGRNSPLLTKEDSITPEHVQRRQDSLDQSFSNLLDLLEYTQGVIEQHEALTLYSQQATVLDSQGQNLLSELQQAIRTIDTSQKGDLEERLHHFSQQVLEFWANKGANLPFPACNEDARATRPSTADDEINTEISNNVFKTYSDLQELVKRLGELFQKLTTTLEYSEQVDRYVEEGTKLTTVIQDLAEEMTGNQLDVYATVCPISSDTMEQFLEQDKMISQKVSCLEVEPLLASMHQVSSQIKESGCDSIDQNSLNAVSTEMLKLYQDLNVLSTDHSARVQAVKDRLAWETKLDHLANSLTSVQEDIRELMNEKSIWISKDQVDHQDKTLDDFSARLAIHDKNVVHYAEEVLSELTHAFQKMEASYLDLKTGPPFFLNRQNEIEKLVAKTQDMIKLQMSEVAFLKMRHDWECKADVELKQCNDLDEKTESFIQETARWSTRSKDTSGIDEIHGAIQKQVQSIQVLQNELAQLQTSSVREQNTLLLTEVTFKKKSALEQAITRIENHEEFAKSILEQSAIISTCIDQVDKLEATAETTKSRFLAANGKNDALDSELQSYKESVKQLDQQLDNSLVYPVRHYRDHDPHSREQDVTHNVQVKEIVHARVSRLNELSGTLESILKSKERLSRRRAAEENYMSESKGVLEWIQSKAEVVDGLYQTSSNIAQASSNVDFESLREAVTTAGATQSAISTYNTSVISLKESSSKYIVMIEQHMDGSGNEEAAESIDRITSTQQSVDTAWTQICDRSDAVKYKLLALLRHSEYFKMVDDFKIQCAQLHDTIVSTDTAFATEEVASKWQNQVHSLDSQSLAPIRYRLNDEESKCKQLGEAPELDQMKQLFATATKDFDQLKQILQQHVTDANNARLKNEYFANANDLQSAMNTIQGELDSLKQKSGHICGDEAKDKGEIEKVDNMYSDICARFDPLLEKYDELRSFYRFLQLNKVSNLEDVQQNSLDTAWKQFKSGVANDKNFVDNTHKWFELSSSMASMGSELALMDQHLNSFESIDGDALPDFFQKDASMLVDMNAQLQHFLATTAKLASTYQDSDSTKANAEMFATRLTELKQTLVQTNNLLKEKHDLAQKQVDNLTGQKFVAEVESIVQNELVKMTNRSEAIIQSSPLVEQVYKTSMTGLANTENKQKELNSYLDTIVKPFIVKLDDNQNILDTLSTSSSLLEKEIMSEKRVNDLMRRILGHEKSGDSILNWLESCQQAIQNVYSLVDDASDEHEAEVELFGLSKKMADFEKTIDSFNAITAEMNEKVSIEDSNTDQDSASLGEMKHSVLSHLTNALEQSTNKVQSQWNLVNEELKTVKKTVEKTMKGIAMARKMKSVTSTVGETREIITSLRVFEEVKYGANSDDSGLEDLESRLSDFETASEIGNDENSIKNLGVSNTEIDQADAHKEPEKELQGSHGSSTCVNEVVVVVQPLTSMLRQPEIEDMLLKLNSVEKDSKIQINKEMDEIQEMMTEDMGVTFTRQHLELKESVGNLNVLISNKKLELEKALDIGKYLSATDDVELFQSALEEALIKATPHHATLIGNGVSRTDLHAKLIELDARFKYYESKVVQSLKLAKEVSTKAAQHEEGAEVSSHLEELQSKWNTIKKKHKTRKIELSRAVDTSADPKDQQARIRKSSLPTRKASSLLRDRADLTLARHSRMSPTNSSTSTIRTTPSISGRLTASSSSSSSSSSFMHSPGRTTSSRFLAPPGHQPSKSATHLKTKSRTTVKKPLNTYVADPQNDLDIEIGRIVNETPYRVKVKMVPGEVGRYWFGNHNPKLAYCRVLKSKMVMVRVGGGWTELSQFLRDHALLEGDFIPRTANSIPEEDEGSKSIQEGFIETRRAQLPSGKPIPRHRSVSPNTQRVYPTGTPSHSTGTQNAGYKDGDKYIAVDHHGNQLEVKMRPVPANIHDIARKSNNNYTNRRIARRKEKRAAS